MGFKLVQYLKNTGWTSNFTFEGRYELTGVTFNIYNFAISLNKKTLEILDVGCSVGLASKSMKKLLHEYDINSTVEGIDRSENVVDKACKNLDVFTCDDIMKITPQRKFDVVIVMNMLYFQNNKDLAKMIEKCSMFLKPDGIMLTNNPKYIREDRFFNKIKICVMSLPKLKHGLRNYYKLIKREMEEDGYIRVYRVAGKEKILDYAQIIRKNWNNYSMFKKFMHKLDYKCSKLHSICNRKPYYKKKPKSYIREIIAKHN